MTEPWRETAGSEGPKWLSRERGAPALRHQRSLGSFSVPSKASNPPPPGLLGNISGRSGVGWPTWGYQGIRRCTIPHPSRGREGGMKDEEVEETEDFEDGEDEET